MSRERILESIRQSNQQLIPLPEINLTEFKTDVDNQSLFIKTLISIGGKVYEVKDAAEIISILQSEFPGVKKIISVVEEIEISTIELKNISSVKELDDLDLAVITGQFGVAENGAIWISEKDMGNRSIPFITSHLAIILDKEKIVQNMHEAYLQLNNFYEGYGVFIAGPSKTADIEQSLVIGAQGALSLSLFLISKSTIPL